MEIIFFNYIREEKQWAFFDYKIAIAKDDKLLSP